MNTNESEKPNDLTIPEALLALHQLTQRYVAPMVQMAAAASAHFAPFAQGAFPVAQRLTEARASLAAPSAIVLRTAAAVMDRMQLTEVVGRGDRHWTAAIARCAARRDVANEVRRFTTEDLRLPADCAAYVAEVLHESRWVEAANPFAYVRRAAVNLRRRSEKSLYSVRADCHFAYMLDLPDESDVSTLVNSRQDVRTAINERGLGDDDRAVLAYWAQGKSLLELPEALGWTSRRVLAAWKRLQRRGIRLDKQ